MDSNCYVVIYRTVMFYIILLIVFKLMGKREIGQLTLLDLVVSVLMAEIAAMAIDNLDRPIHEVLIAVGLLGLLQLRANNISSIFEVEYAILETNGQLSSFKKSDISYSPLPIITSGGIEKENLLKIAKDEQWIKSQLEKQGIFSEREVYYAAYDGKELRCLTRNSLNLKEKKRH